MELKTFPPTIKHPLTSKEEIAKPALFSSIPMVLAGGACVPNVYMGQSLS